MRIRNDHTALQHVFSRPPFIIPPGEEIEVPAREIDRPGFIRDVLAAEKAGLLAVTHMSDADAKRVRKILSSDPKAAAFVKGKRSAEQPPEDPPVTTDPPEG